MTNSQTLRRVDHMAILIGAVALLYLMWVGLYAIFVIIAAIITGVRVNWREL